VNYLAHLYFSDPEPLAWAGSLMGDFHKGAISQQFPHPLRRHLSLHRRIDSLTQQNTYFQTSRRRLDPRYRYARSILVDVFYDHFLAQNWQNFHHLSLYDFSQQVYAGLAEQQEHLSPGLLQILPAMTEHNWLYSYRLETIVARVLQRLEQRLNHRLPLAAGFTELHRWRKELEIDFAAFMLDSSAFVERWKSENT
jgi:acyl carrier protein phosphodiesterase